MKIENLDKGFTIIELLVVIAIVAILPAVIISNFPAAQLQFNLSRTAYRFAQEVRGTQDRAISSLPYTDSLGQEQEVLGYGIHIDLGGLGNKVYRVYADSQNDASSSGQYDDLDYIVKTTDFSAESRGIIIKEITGTFDNKISVNFEPPNPTTTITDFTESKNSIDIVFAIESDLNKTRTVSINSAGLVEVK